MPIANVALTNTFDEWRNITNQLVSVVSGIENINVRMIFDTTNVAYAQANTGRNLANTANITADLAYNQANTSRTHANAAHLTANAGFVQANTARDLANTVSTNATNAFGRANTANITADLAFNKANTSGTDATNAFGRANTANITADLAYGQANTARTHANAAHLTANAGFDQANTARTHANAAHLTANVGFDQANTARTHANAAHLTANAGFVQANTARNLANNALANGMSNTFSTLTISTLALAGNIVLTGNIVASANLTGSTLFDNKGDLRVIPANERAAVYALAKSDVGKFVTISTSSNVHVPNAIFTQGDAITIYNNSSASMNIVSNSAVTMYLSGTATTGTRVLTQRGVATVLCVFANNFVISGSGLT